MTLCDLRLRLRKQAGPRPCWWPVGCAAAYDVYASAAADVFLGTCHRLGAGPGSWYARSAFDTRPLRGFDSRQDCLWELARAFRKARHTAAAG